MEFSTDLVTAIDQQQLMLHELENNDWDLSGDNIRLLHAAGGIAKEGGELLDLVYKVVCYRKPIDWLKLMDESGDVWFYFVQALDVIFKGSMEKKLLACALINQAKLGHRYPNGCFTEKDAIGRNKLEESACQMALAQKLGQFDGRIIGGTTGV